MFQRNVPGCLANPQYLALTTHCQGLLESSCTISLRMDLLLPFHHVTRYTHNCSCESTHSRRPFVQAKNATILGYIMFFNI